MEPWLGEAVGSGLGLAPDYLRTHPEVMAICVGGGLCALFVDGPLGDNPLASSFDENQMGRSLSRPRCALSSKDAVVAFVRTLLLEELRLPSPALVLTYVIVENMVRNGLALSQCTLRPMLVAASVLALKLGSDGSPPSLEVFGEPLAVLEELELACLQLLKWRIPIAERTYDAAAEKLLALLDSCLDELRPRATSPTSTLDLDL
eukprot:CAMPEP_0181213022 /NCGR_PEP_ID=MMETSP1096-20121128/24676_1 /TAXON_ID=156174 ORGANISM="Chrysochromulina ericina, Strain CCMP281" /NCGR_SAMPLE_ID=MMETSP1096 /ASSEMBLY_ACC=CAM_ASM_000453 /LENGTH=204 /DNA_ID=CAMNT_0023304619 /DNA_START=50 /DNA_END=664 /DNA_ORIENTATION=+